MSFRSLTLLSSVFLLQACFVYDQDLLDEGRAGLDTTGGSSPGSGGETAGTGGSTPGTGGVSSGDGDGDTGGSPSTGGEATGGTGGDSTGGTGGDSTGGSGGGATGGRSYVLVDDLEHVGASYSSDLFSGAWSWYDCDDGNENIATLIKDREDDPGNQALNVFKSGLGAGCWGGGVIVSLSGYTDSVDISSYDGVSFLARFEGDTDVLTVKIEDNTSRDGLCVDDDCNDHPRANRTLGLTWTEYHVPFSVFDRAGTAELDLTTAWAIHFEMQPSSDTINFFIDDIRFYTDP